MAEMKVLSHEADSLAGDLHSHVSGKKQKYTKLAREILEELQQQQPAERRVDLTAATYALFGMMNWIYNWYDPNGKLKVSELVDNVTRLFLHGFVAESPAEELDFTPRPKTESLSVWRGSPPTLGLPINWRYSQKWQKLKLTRLCDNQKTSAQSRSVSASSEGVAFLTLNDPPANTYTYEMMQALDRAILAARMDEAVQVIVITGNGEKFFCAGADIQMLAERDANFQVLFLSARQRNSFAVWNRLQSW